MRAAVTRDKSLVVTEVPDPVPGEGQVLVRTLACGICGSDLHALGDPEAFMETTRRSGGTPYDPRDGLVFGHEYSGEIVAHGPGTTGELAAGTVVCGPPIGVASQGSGIVGYTPFLPGGFGEYMVLNEFLTMPVPNGLDPRAAALTEPFAVAHRAVRRARLAGDEVAVVLGLGPIGLGVVATLKARGHSGPVLAVDFSPARRGLAATLGADEVLDPAENSPYDAWARFAVPVTTADRIAHSVLGMPTRAGVVFECVGVPGIWQQVIDGAPAGGKLVAVGVCMPPDTIEPGVAVGKELEIIGTFGAMPDEYRATLHDIAEGRIDASAIITGEVGLDGVAGAFEDLARPNTHAKVVVNPRA